MRFPRFDTLGCLAVPKRTIFGWGSSKEAEKPQAPQPKPAAIPNTPPSPAASAPLKSPKAQSEAGPKIIQNKPTIPGVKHIVAVASGKVRKIFGLLTKPNLNTQLLLIFPLKGGVGKSTVAVNLAMALMQHVRSLSHY